MRWDLGAGVIYVQGKYVEYATGGVLMLVTLWTRWPNKAFFTLNFSDDYVRKLETDVILFREGTNISTYVR